jgi:hypothetical protein
MFKIIRREGNKLEIEADAEWFESVVRSAYEREQIKKVRRCE